MRGLVPNLKHGPASPRMQDTRKNAMSHISVPSGPAQAKGLLDVFSCGIGPIPKHIQQKVLLADHVFAAQGLLSQLSAETGQKKSPVLHNILPSPRDALREAVALVSQGKNVCLLASGDALYHGIGSTLAGMMDEMQKDEADGEKITVRFHPGLTAFQVLCHKIGLPWEKARLFSVHSGSASLRPLLEAPFAIIYTGLPLTPSRLAQALCALHPASQKRCCILAEKLGSAEEYITRCTLQDVATAKTGPTGILVLLPQGAVPMPLPLGLDDAAYAFENHCLTARQVRPLVLSCLRLPAFGELWDLGAGSGSVSIEAAMLRPDLHISAVERVPARCRNIEHNLASHCVSNVTLHEGDSLALMAALPQPDRVFIGGGGKDLPELLRLSLAALNKEDPLACVVVSAITLETTAILQQFKDGILQETMSVDIAVSAPIGSYTRLSPLNRIHIFVFTPKNSA